MKKLLFLFVMMLLPMIANAEAVEIDGIYYNLISKGKIAEVTSNPIRYSGNVTIPEKVKYEGTEYSVTSIGHYAFQNCSGMTSITIPNSVTSFGDFAFAACHGLTSLTIPNSVTSIGDYAFFLCQGLISIIISNSVTSIGSFSFSGCNALASVTIGNSVTSIGEEAFSSCIGLTSIIIPNSVTSIGKSAFQKCTGLTSITIPNSLTSIEYGVFSGCSSLTSIIIPNSVTSIGFNAFYGCTSLTSITIPNSVTSIGKCAFEGCSGLTSITIPHSVKIIGGGTFWGCVRLSSITIPNSVTIIEDESFCGCTGLTSIIIPNSVTSIGPSAFKNCIRLVSVTIGCGIKTIGKMAFSSCPELVDIFCYAEAVPSTSADAFIDSYAEYATLHVPASSVNAYKATEPWKNFNKVVGIGGDIPESSKCSTPSISYNNGELTFSCETEGVQFVYEITDADIKKGYDAKVKLDATYHISVYATRSGFENSDFATATLCWVYVDPKTEGISNGVANVRAMPVMIQNNGNTLNISGVPEGSVISVYDLSGQMVGSAKAGSETTYISTSLQNGEIGIVKIGDKSVKVIMK